MYISAIHRISGTEVTVQMINKGDMNMDAVDKLRETVTMYKICAHPGVRRLYDYFETEKHLFLCLEKGQSLQCYHPQYHVYKDFDMYKPCSFRNYIKKQTYPEKDNTYMPFKEKRGVEIATWLSKALGYLHDRGIIVRDLDIDSLVMTKSTDQGQARIQYFNNAILCGPEDKVDGIFGNINFKAPEVIKGQPYDAKADSWSFGVILFYMLTSQYPFPEGDKEAIMDDKVQPRLNLLRDLEYTENCIDLVNKMLHKNPVLRPKVKAVQKHNWLQTDFNKNSVYRKPTIMRVREEKKEKIEDNILQKQILHEAGLTQDKEIKMLRDKRHMKEVNKTIVFKK